MESGLMHLFTGKIKFGQMSNEQKTIVYLLHIIEADGDIKKLKHFGLSYRQIGELIELNIKSGYLQSDDDMITLTGLGKEYLMANKSLIKERDKSKWIDVDFKSKIKQIDKEDVFLPSRNELSFLK
jgi:hypothetical protein